jgi:hypothetical protein
MERGRAWAEQQATDADPFIAPGSPPAHLKSDGCADLEIPGNVKVVELPAVDRYESAFAFARSHM